MGTRTEQRPRERVELLDRERLEQFVNLHVELCQSAALEGVPPANSTLPEESKVAVWYWRAVGIVAAEAQASVAGSYTSEDEA